MKAIASTQPAKAASAIANRNVGFVNVCMDLIYISKSLIHHFIYDASLLTLCSRILNHAGKYWRDLTIKEVKNRSLIPLGQV